MAFRFLAESAFARALPPLAAPSADRAWACGFFPSAGFKTSPVASSTTRRAFCAKSARLPPLLARVGIRAVCHGAIMGAMRVLGIVAGVVALLLATGCHNRVPYPPASRAEFLAA